MIPVPNLARLIEMRRKRSEGWSYRAIAEHHELSPERATQLLQRDPMVARTYGPWVVFNDIPFLVLCRPNKEARIKKYMQERREALKDPNYPYRPYRSITGHPTRAARNREISAYWQCMVIRYFEEKGDAPDIRERT